MSYYLYDAKGYVGDLASNSGLEALIRHIGDSRQARVRTMFRRGYALISGDLHREVRELPHSFDPDVETTLRNFQSLINKCEEIVIITDGVGID